MFKRGYKDGEQTIEIYEGRVDLVLYNDKPNKPSFYFYRFQAEEVLGEKLSKEVSLVHRKSVERFLKKKGFDYANMIDNLLEMAWSSGMKMRDEM